MPAIVAVSFINEGIASIAMHRNCDFKQAILGIEDIKKRIIYFSRRW